jgi:hypothetical protein
VNLNHGANIDLKDIHGKDYAIGSYSEIFIYCLLTLFFKVKVKNQSEN